MSFDPRHCLRLRSRFASCSRCAEACAARVLRFGGRTLELAEGCIGCGRCAAACPAGALNVEGFVFDRLPRQETQPALYIDCWKVPSSETRRNALRVPCLGGIALHHLVELYACTDGARIVLLDRGWCERCSANGRGQAQQALSAAGALLAELGVPERNLPGFELQPLPRCRMPEDIPALTAPKSRARRRFLSGMTRDPARTFLPWRLAQGASDGRALEPVREPAVPEVRARLLAQAAAIARRYEGALPGALYPNLRVSDACRNHRVCATACRTRALRLFRDENGAAEGLAFDAAACVACGDCARACPERALTLLPQGERKPAPGPVRLTQWVLRECEKCFDPFAGPGAGNLCPRCRKSQQWARQAFSQSRGEAEAGAPMTVHFKPNL